MKKAHHRLIIIAAGLVSLVLGVAIILYNFNSNIIFFYSPSQLKVAHIKPKSVIRVGGLVKAGSVKKLGDATTEFILTDLQQDTTVQYRGILPNLFREGQGMVAKGSLETSGILYASELLAKHDENYMPKEVADELKKSGLWNPDQ